jgi:hypothetical protein
MVQIEEFNLKVQRIPKSQLAREWKNISRNPLPKIAAFKLNDSDFEHVLVHRNCVDDEQREILEWGRVLSTGGTDACVFNAEQNADADYIILVRENPYHTLKEIIHHELSHIANGDL